MTVSLCVLVPETQASFSSSRITSDIKHLLSIYVADYIQSSLLR